MGRYQEKHSQQGKVVAQIEVIAFSIDKFLDIESFRLPGIAKETPLQLEISLINVNDFFSKV